MGQTGHPRCQNDLSEQHGLTSHRIFQSACCSLPCVSVSCPFPVHALVLHHPPVCLLRPLPQSPFGCFCVNTLALIGLLENLLWSWRDASAMWGLWSPGRIHVQAAAGCLSSQRQGTSAPCCCPPPCALEILEPSHLYLPSPADRTPSKPILWVWPHQND